MLALSSAHKVSDRPFLQISSTIQEIKNRWRGLVVKPYTLPVKTQGAKHRRIVEDDIWLDLNATNGKFLIKISDVAELLHQTEKSVTNQLADGATQQTLNKNLQERFSIQPWDELHKLLKLKLANEAEVLLEKVKKTYDKVIREKLFLNGPRKKHFTRKKSGTHLPIEVGSDGQVYAILKNTKTSEPFAKGFMKDMFYAVNLHTLKLVAWGKIRHGKPNTPDSLQIKEFINKEIAIQDQLKYPQFVNLIHATSWGCKGEKKTGMLMELCDGDVSVLIKELHNPPQKNNIKSLEIFWDILEDSLSALTYLEREPVKIHHRDIKPENLFFIRREGRCRGKLGDFGFAKKIDEEKSNTIPNGSPLYLSPEFIKGMDLWALGNKLLLDAKAKFDFYTHAIQSERNLILQISQLSKSVKTPQVSIEEAVKVLTLERAKFKSWGEIQLAESNMLKIQAEALIAQGSEMMATTKTDLWAMGLTLFEMRTCKDSLCLLTDNPNTTLSELYSLIRSVTQEGVNRSFQNVVPETLAALNLQMLTVDVANRPTAAKCLEIVRTLRAKKVKFQ